MTRHLLSLTAAVALCGGAGAAGGEAPSSSLRVTREELVQHRTLSGGSIVDSETAYRPSTESAYDHMIDLLPPDGPVSLSFHWDDDDGRFTGRMIHRAPSAEIDAGWLGFGIYDISKKGEPTEVRDLMVGSQAIIGNVGRGTVSKYRLGAKNLGPGGVEEMESNMQTLIPAGTEIIQHEADDGHVNTILTFTKLYKEESDEEIEIFAEGLNAFLYAVGPPATGDDPTDLGFHILKGAFLIDFEKISEMSERAGAGGEEAKQKLEGAAGEVEDAAAADVLCQSDDPAYQHSMDVTDKLHLKYKLNDDSLTVQLTYDGKAWLGFGPSPTGNMIGSDAVIGRPDLAMADDEKPLKYKLSGKSMEGVQVMVAAQETLKDASVKEKGGKTILEYAKKLKEAGEVEISREGYQTFVYAIGASNTLAYHKESGAFQLDLARCEVKPREGKDGTTTTGGTIAAGGGDSSTLSMSGASNDISGSASSTKSAPASEGGQLSMTGLWIAHGAVATFAWAIFTPAAVTTAWFRTLVPSSWIYVHVFANVASFSLTTLAVVIAIVTISLGGGSRSHFSEVHHFAGIGMLVLVTFQVGNGFLRPPVEKRDPYADEPTGPIPCPQTAREWWKIGHRLMGTALLGVGLWQITTGLDLYAAGTGGTSWKPYFMYYFIVFAAVIVVLRIWMWCEERRARRTVDMMGEGGDHMGPGGVGHYGDENDGMDGVQ